MIQKIEYKAVHRMSRAIFSSQNNKSNKIRISAIINNANNITHQNSSKLYPTNKYKDL
jgi:hypothetical protein